MDATASREGAARETLATEGKVRAVIEKVRPYIQSHGGDVWLERVEGEVAYLRIEGTCSHCPLASLTYNKVVRTLIGEEAPEITRIELV